ncbi:MAG: hypothetical protein KGD60_13130 [Candidatus Thorarchaeota archaeon]|nr:hypothetical protein [Candidatus Thorarchaeota archaeon]
MSELETLRTSFVALLDGLWWGLRENTGPLSMYEGFARGFKQMGLEIAEKSGGKGGLAAAEIAGQLFGAIGLDVAVDEKTVTVKKCPVWNRILERGLEYSFHVEEICWMPMLEGIGEKTGVKPVMESALRLAHIEGAKVDYKKDKVKAALDKSQITREEYDKEMVVLKQRLENSPKLGLYRFK